MIGREQALKIARDHLQKQGHDLGEQDPTVKFVTRPNANDPKSAWLKEHRPEAWEHIQHTHRDHWSIACDTMLPPNAKPRYFFVNVDAETGAVSVLPGL
jgi:hypothetical protein